MTETDSHYLRAAITLARQAGARGDGPYGAVLVDARGTVIAEATNTLVTGRDCTGHAELNLVRAAWGRVGPAVLAGCTLYASAEPCAMCAGAIYWSGISRVVYAIDAGRIAALLGMPRDLALNCRAVLAHGRRPVEVIGPALVDEAAGVFTTPRP